MSKFGRILSVMVFQNIPVLIAVGVIRALFGVYGWWPDDRIMLIIPPLLNQLVPVLFAYTGGRLLGGQRGGVVASIVVLGLTLASSVPMILGALLLGPFIGWLIGRLDKLLENRIPAGFELLIGNLVAAILAVLFTILCFTYVGQTLSFLIKDFLGLFEMLIRSGWLPITSILIEPAKVFFLNNVMNHGVLGPLGIHQAKDLGKSIFFLLETNPGPGLGVLLAYYLKTKGKERTTVGSTAVIHALGGIHEVYFPFVLLKPSLFIAIISGGMAGITVFQHLDAGLVATPSPASVLLHFAFAPQDDLLPVAAGILTSIAVSFITSLLLLKRPVELPASMIRWEDGQPFQPDRPAAISAADSEGIIEPEPIPAVGKKQPISTILFACDAGMASSAMGAALLRKKLKAAGLDLAVKHSSVDEIPEDADVIIVHKSLVHRAREAAPGKTYITIESFTDTAVYEQLVDRLKNEERTHEQPFLTEEHIILGCKADTKEEAIEIVGRRMMQTGLIIIDYIDEMVQRERLASTYIGNGVAIPHGINGGSPAIVRSGIVIAQFPDGVPFDKETAFLLIGIAGHGKLHVGILSLIADAVKDMERVRELFATRSKTSFITVFDGLKEAELRRGSEKARD